MYWYVSADLVETIKCLVDIDFWGFAKAEVLRQFMGCQGYAASVWVNGSGQRTNAMRLQR
jgi:hypothetical protein